MANKPVGKALSKAAGRRIAKGPKQWIMTSHGPVFIGGTKGKTAKQFGKTRVHVAGGKKRKKKVKPPAETSS